MFFHSKREVESAKIFGITDKFGLKLINQKHPFPYLVEQEERYHGAIVSNTTYGGIYRLFESLQYNDSYTNIDKDFVYPEGLIPEETKNLFNLCRAFRRKAIDNSLQVHESFAKYIAYAKQAGDLKSWPPALQEMLEMDCREYSYLRSLVQVLGLPDCNNTKNNIYQLSVSYILAKWILTTDELDRLFEMDNIFQFKNFIENEYIQIPSVINSRAENAIRVLQQQIEKVRNIFFDYDSSKNSSTDEDMSLYWGSHLREIYNLIGKEMQQSGFAHLPVQGAKGIFIKVIVITSKIQLLSRYIQSVHKREHVDMQIAGPIVRHELKETVGTMPALLSADLSFRVRYDQRYNEHSRWKFIFHPDQIREDIGSATTDAVFIYPAINKNNGLDCFLSLHGEIGADGKGYYKNYVFSAQTFKEMIEGVKCIRARSKIIVLLPFQMEGLPAFKTAARLLSATGYVVFWTHNADFFNIYLPDVNHFFLGTRKFLAEARRIIGMPDSHPFMDVLLDSNFCFFSCAPHYFVDFLWGLKAQNLSNDYISDPESRIVFQAPDTTTFIYLNGTELTLTDGQQKNLLAAIKAYEIIYEYSVLPTYLPLYDSKEMFNHINTLNNE